MGGDCCSRRRRGGGPGLRAQVRDSGFDPLGLYPKDEAGKMEMQEKEMIHGRVAMVAIVAFAAQEFVSKVPVTRETPFFFEPIWTFVTQELHFFDLSAGYISY